MRLAIMLGLLVLGLGGVFYFFVLRTPADLAIVEQAMKPTTVKVVPSTIPSLDGNVPVGRTADVWAESIDSRTGRVVNAFSSEDVIPRADGSVDVVKPRARFFGKDGGVVTLEGSRGHVFYTQAGSPGDAKALGTSTPTSGDLRDVTIRFYERSMEEDPMIVVSVPAVRFDANSNRVATIDCVVDGQGYAAEQVPITMRGRDFDFDGQGLTVAWNDREGMLDQLEILRGNRLLVHDVSKFIGDQVVAAPRPQPPVSLASALFGVVMVQNAPPRQDDLYQATFDKDVRVLKNNEEIASGEIMRCIIPLGQKKKADAPERPAHHRKAAMRRAAADAPPPSPSAAPTTQPQPLEIRWTGKLTVRPARVISDAPQTQMVELTGAPARVAEKGTYAVGRLIRVEPEAGRVRIEPGGSVRTIEIKDATGAELRSRSPLAIDEASGNVVIDGGGALSVPARPDQTAPLQMTWSKRLSLRLSDTKPVALRSILVEGEANVDSDRLKMTCDSLELGFAPGEPAGQDEGGSRFSMPSPDLSLLRTVHARGDAVCAVGAEGAQRVLRAADIQLGFAGGEGDALLNSILCDGDVSLVDAGKLDLQAGSLSVQTKPILLSKSGGLDDDFFQLVTGLSAQKAVRIRRPDGSSLEGEDLDLSGEGAAQRLVLGGEPALLSSARGSLKGKQIELDPATGDVRVPTTGSFAGTNPDRPGTDISVAWEESMNINGQTGACDFHGAIQIAGRDEQGSAMVANARSGTMQFATGAPSTQPAAGGLGAVNFESVRSLQLDGGVDLSVSTVDQRRSWLETPTLSIDLVSGTMLAPQRGRMLMIDDRQKPAALAATRPAGRFGPGALAMRWDDHLRWDMRGGELTLNGGVRVGFERQGSDDPVRITCDRITGVLTPLDTSNGFDQMTPRIDLKLLKAQGNVVVRSNDVKFDSADLVYDLQTQLASARGTETQPVEVISKDGTSRIGFSSIVWNLETGMLEDFRDITGQIRR